ncbi:MAG: hypothetical protein WCC30_01065 [Candidatus Dormiibacterota bacterium]
MTWRIGQLLTAVLAGVVLAACASSQATNTSEGHTSLGSGQCAKPCVLFHVQINFTGLDAIQGSFVDNDCGSGFNSCSEWASGDSVGWVLGPGTLTSAPVVIGGKGLNFGFSISKDKFHGPGSYASVLAGGGVTVGPDTFLGNSSTETLNADGSGQANFSNLEGGSTTGPQGTESGTVTWTCSK